MFICTLKMMHHAVYTCEIESGSNLGMRLHISIFHSVGCFVDAIWKIESDFQLPFTDLLAVFVKIDNIVMHMRPTCSCVGATRRAFLLEWIYPLAVFSSNFICLRCFYSFVSLCLERN